MSQLQCVSCTDLAKLLQKRQETSLRLKELSVEKPSDRTFRVSLLHHHCAGGNLDLFSLVGVQVHCPLLDGQIFHKT